MNLTNFATQESVISGYLDHIIIVFVIVILTPLFTYFGLKKQLKFIEQIVAILLVFLTTELIIYLIPFIIQSLKSLF